MFGEEALLGQNELSVDTKGRIYIPTDTKRETGEKLVLLYDEELDVHKIYSFDKIQELLNELNKKILNSQDKMTEINYKRKLYEICKSILRCEKVSEQGKILTGKTFKNQDKVLSIGAYDHLIIEPIKNKK